MTRSTSTLVKSVEKPEAPRGIALRTVQLDQEVNAHSADLARRHAKKLHDQGMPKSAKELIVKFAEGSLEESVTIGVTEKMASQN